MQKFEIKKVTIDKLQNNKRLDKSLTLLLNDYSRTHIKILLLNQNVKKSNKIITNPSYKVKEGEIYQISIPKIKENIFNPQNIPLNIVFEDKNIIIVNKPAGLVTHPAPGNKDQTLLNGLLFHTKNKLSSINDNENRPGIVHRLDKDTSGLIVIAKNNNSHIFLAKQFKDHSINRKYQAIVWGVPRNQIIKGYIERHKINRKKMILNKFNKGKYSETHIKIKKSYGICSLIECSLKTGRTHQIRVHLNSINCPIVGDKIYSSNKVKKYSNDKKNYNKFMILKNSQRQALHAGILGFVHPESKKLLNFKSNLPDDMLKLLEFLSKY